MKRTGLLWIAVVAVISVGCSRSETPKTQASEQRPPAAIGTGGAASNDVKSDDDFVHDVAIMNMAEIELSRIALSNGTSADVRSFAQRMIDDHGAAGNKLKVAVGVSQIEWPAQLDDKHRKTVDELAKKQGSDFDREYAEAMVHGHQDLAARLESRLDLKSVADWKAAAAGLYAKQGDARTESRNGGRRSSSRKERQRADDQSQSVGGRHLPRDPEAPGHRENAGERDEEAIDQLKGFTLSDTCAKPSPEWPSASVRPRLCLRSRTPGCSTPRN